MCNEIKVGVACYMSVSNNERTAVSWENELHKEQKSTKKEPQNATGRKNELFLFNE